jgi:hypothetical protein
LLTLLLAAQALGASPDVAQQKDANPACGVQVYSVSLEPQLELPAIPPFGWSYAAQEQALRIAGRAAPLPEKAQPPEGQIPEAAPENREPSVLLPKCQEEPRKRRKRKNDYPMG